MQEEYEGKKRGVTWT